MKLTVDDLRVTSFSTVNPASTAPAVAGAVTILCASRNCSGDPQCVTQQYETCETGPYYYC